ncbi:hypothetical protein DY000_02038747 [Brassica cretica]|uniref:Methionyl/Leucyl tRNA synthetase domain-containing protein n=1 Tax=Brassica cretica TaxID=69181 RepID=A0ABQ7BBZ2_BRACR|nr:hypothetical protein DY000_02038747 [Brassica cretica]
MGESVKVHMSGVRVGALQSCELGILASGTDCHNKSRLLLLLVYLAFFEPKRSPFNNTPPGRVVFIASFDVTVKFPSAQRGSGENWTMAKTVRATEYLNYEGGNFSKSEGVGVFGNDVRFTNIPVSDASFKWKDLQGKLNSKLLGLGNFVNRVLLLIAGYGSVIPDAPRAKSHILTKCVGDKVGRLVAEYVKAMEKVQLKHGLNTAMLVVGQGHKYWRLYKGDKSRSAVFSRTAAGLVHLVARLLKPFMRSFSLGKDEDVEWYKEMFAGSLAPERARRRPRPVEAASSAMDALAI